MCFAPPQRALFRHLNVQKCSEHVMPLTFSLGNVLRAATACIFFSISTSNHGVLCTFWLGNVLHAKTASTFPASQLPKVVRTWCVLYVLTWKGASRHNGVQFFISDLASWLRTRGFSEPTVRPSWATNHWKTKWIATFLPFRAPASSSLIFSLLLFQLSILSEVSLLNLLR